MPPGSVASRLRYGEISNDNFTTNLLLSLLMKKLIGEMHLAKLQARRLFSLTCVHGAPGPERINHQRSILCRSTVATLIYGRPME